tara:strand:+ start:3096 stop:3530 length:435 start_codon:yes stop_codon:yes gene_type:complete
MSHIWRTARTSLAVGTDAYAQGDALGTKISFSVPDEGIIRSMVITDVDDEASVTVNVWVFESEPTGIAANAAFALADADAELVQGVHLIDTDFDSINNRVKYEEMAMPYVARGGLLHVQCELEGSATPTFAATTDVRLMLVIEH